jgi:hypothetical protein
LEEVEEEEEDEEEENHGVTNPSLLLFSRNFFSSFSKIILTRSFSDSSIQLPFLFFSLPSLPFPIITSIAQTISHEESDGRGEIGKRGWGRKGRGRKEGRGREGRREKSIENKGRKEGYCKWKRKSNWRK